MLGESSEESNYVPQLGNLSDVSSQFSDYKIKKNKLHFSLLCNREIDWKAIGHLEDKVMLV